MREDDSLGSPVGSHRCDLSKFEPVLLQDVPNFGDGLSDESRAEISRRFFPTRNEKVHRWGVHRLRGGRGILRHHLVRVTRPGEYGNFSHRQPSLNGSNPGRAHAISDQVGNRQLGKPQADQHMHVLPHLQGGAGRRHLLRNLIRRILRAINLVFDFQFQAQPGGDALSGLEGNSHELGHAFLPAVNGEPDGGDGTE